MIQVGHDTGGREISRLIEQRPIASMSPSQVSWSTCGGLSSCRRAKARAKRAGKPPSCCAMAARSSTSAQRSTSAPGAELTSPVRAEMLHCRVDRITGDTGDAGDGIVASTRDWSERVARLSLAQTPEAGLVVQASS